MLCYVELVSRKKYKTYLIFQQIVALYFTNNSICSAVIDFNEKPLRQKYISTNFGVTTQIENLRHRDGLNGDLNRRKNRARKSLRSSNQKKH